MRDPDAWYDSASKTIFFPQTQPWRLMRKLTPSTWRHVAMVRAVIWDRIFKGKFSDRGYAITVYKQWIEEVKANVPADKLLIFDCKQGWGPLCAFLNLPEPIQKFPHSNTNEDFQARYAKRIRHQFIKEFVLPVSVVALAVWLAVRAKPLPQRL